MKKTTSKLTAGAAGLLLVAGIAVAVNLIAARTPVRADLTREKLYTLSDGTRKLLGGLDRDVTLKFYFSRSQPGTPSYLKQYAQRIQDLLREYERLGGSHVTLELLDPKPDSDEEEWAQRSGLQAQALDPYGLAQVYLGLHLQSGAREQAVPFFAPQEEERLEYTITRAILDITEAKKPKVGLLSTLPVMGAPPMMNPFGPRQGGEEPWAFVGELRNQFEIESLSQTIAEIPTNIDTLVVLHPKGLSDDTLFALDQFVLRGGRLIAFVDPQCVSDQSQQQGMMMGMPPGPGSSDLNRLTKAWGIEMDPAMVVSDGTAATMIRGMGGRPQRSTSWLSLRGANMDRSQLAVGTLDFVMLPFAGAFKGKPADGLKMDTLIKSSESAAEMPGMEATMGNDSPFGPKVTPAGAALPMAIRLTGTFKTAFPEGKPRGEGEPVVTNVVALKEGTKPGVVVLVGDVDLLADPFAVRRIDLGMMGYQAYELANDNIVLLNNLIEQNSGSDILIGLRSRGTSRRPFDRVVAMEEAAAQQWRAEEERLQEQLNDVRTKLSELQRTKNKEQQLVLSPEQRREIDKFREQQVEVSKRLKEVRKNLRQDIESLGLKLKILNIAAVPFAVALFGLLLGGIRRGRSAS